MSRPPNHDPDRRPHLLHRPNLYWRSMSAQQQPLPLRLGLLSRDEQRILRIPRRMVRRKIQSLEVVVIRFDDGPLRDGIPQLLKHRNNLPPSPHDGMFRPNRPPYSGQSDVDTFRREEILPRTRNVRPLYELRNPRFQFIDANPGLALRLLRRALQPKVINLGE